MELIEDPSECQHYTGEPSVEVLKTLFEYLNADGAMAAMVTVSRDDSEDQDKDQAGDTGRNTEGYHARSLWERFVMYMVSVRRLRSHAHTVANMFNVHVSTVRRNYATWALSVAFVFRHQQPMPSAAQVARVTPAQVRARIGLDQHSAFLYADCTERFCDDSGDRAVHAAIHSDYKKHCTLKVLTILVGNTYIAHISGAYCGGITDTALHVCDGVPQMLPVFERTYLTGANGERRSTHARTVYVFDRGLTSVTALASGALSPPGVSQ